MDEYNALRAELVSKQEKKSTVWLHMYILYMTLFVLGLESSHYFFLLTFVIIIPYQAVINNLEWNVSRISAYLRIFFENEDTGHRWETMNTQFPPYTKFLNRQVKSLSGFVRHAGSIHLGLMSVLFFVGSLLEQSKALGCRQWAQILFAAALFLVVVMENRRKKKKVNAELIGIMEDYKRQCEAAAPPRRRVAVKKRMKF